MKEQNINDYFNSIADTISDMFIKDDLSPIYTKDGFVSICTIFSSAIISKCLELGEKENMTDDEIGLMLESSTKELVKYIKTYTGITI